MRHYLVPLLLLSAPLLPLHSDADSQLVNEETQQIVISNRILAKVNGKTISVMDVMKKMDLFLQKNYPDHANSVYGRFQFYNSQWKENLSQMIDQQLMLADAEKLEVKVNDAEVREEILDRFGPNVMPTLDKIGLSYEEARKMIHEEMIVQRMMWYRVNSKALNNVNPKDIKKAYQAYCDKNPALEEWKYQVLTIRSASQQISASLAQRAYDIMQARLDFEQIAAQLKEDNTDAVITVSQEIQADEKSISQQHKDALKTLKPGLVSQPISQMSRADNSIVYRLFFLKEHSVRKLPTFTKISEQLKDELLGDAFDKQNKKYIAHLRHKLGFDEKQMLETLPPDFQPFTLR